MAANDNKNNIDEEEVLYSVLTEALKCDARWEEEQSSPLSRDWTRLNDNKHQNIIVQGNDDTCPGFVRDDNINKKSLQPLAVGQQQNYNYNASTKVDCCLGSISQKSLKDVRGRLALACQNTKAMPLQGYTKWRRWRSKISKAKTDQPNCTTYHRSTNPHTQTTSLANSGRTMTATLSSLLHGSFGLPRFHLPFKQKQPQKTHTHTHEHHCGIVLSSTLELTAWDGLSAPATIP